MGVYIAVSGTSLGFTGIWWYADFKSVTENIVLVEIVPWSIFAQSRICGLAELSCAVFVFNPL